MLPNVCFEFRLSRLCESLFTMIKADGPWMKTKAQMFPALTHFEYDLSENIASAQKPVFICSL